ncbi:hypothetical protein Tco_1369766 [Tanacetum coccineum]
MHYTWIKSPSSPATSVMKKLDRVLANEEFLDKYNQAFVVFHPFIVSDHSPSALILPHSFVKKRKSFKFANFVADKKEFIPLVTKCWFDDIDGFHCSKIVKKLKGLKKHIKDLQWKNGDLFERVDKLRSKLKEAQMNVNKFPFDSKIKELAATTVEEFC